MTLKEVAVEICKRYGIGENEVYGRFMGLESPLAYEYTFYVGSGRSVSVYCDDRKFYLESPNGLEQGSVEHIIESFEKAMYTAA